MNLNGILAPICTPFHENGEIDHEALRRNIGRYSKTGLLGFIVSGSTGEAPLLSVEEKRTLFATVREAADGRTLVAGTGLESVRETVALTRDAARLGYDVALVLTPHYFRGQMLRPETQVAFFRAVADASPIPILVYDIPQNTGIDLPLEVVQRLAEHPNIVGIKESSPDLEKVSRLTSQLPEGFHVLVGNSGQFHDCLRLGAVGGVLGIANALPAPTLAIYERYSAGDVEGSAAAQRQIVAPAGVPVKYGIQGLKYAMELMGYDGGPARLPLLPLDEQQKAEIGTLFDGMRRQNSDADSLLARR